MNSNEPAGSALKGRTGLRRLLNATRYSATGLHAAYKHEAAFRQELWIAVMLIPVALLVPATALGRAVMIASLLLVSALNLCVSAIAVMPQALLARRLDFRPIAIGGLVGSLSSSVLALLLAYRGFGVWALVWQPLFGTLITFVYLAWQARWRPSLIFDLQSTRGLIKFSGHIFGSNLIGHFARNFHQIITGPTLGAAAMGAISLAQTVAWLPIAQVTTASVKAIYPIFATIQDSRDRMATGLLRAMEMVTLLTFPMVFCLAALADLVTPVVFGPQWAAAAPLVAVFCASSAVQCVSFVAGSTLLATGNSRIGLILNVFGAVTIGVTMFLLRETNALVVSIGFAATSSLPLLIGFFIAVRNLAMPWGPVIAGIARPAAAAGLTALILLFLKEPMAPIEVHLRLVALAGVGLLSYFGLTLILNRTALSSAVALLRGSFQRRRK